ncbi:hypothetical protein HHI36_001462, partial [Cryptolaemus montrouzieri]
NLLDEIKSRKQDHREQITLFISTMEAQFNRLTSSIPQQEIVEIIRYNLSSDYMKDLVHHVISTIPELTSLSKRIEDSSQLHRDYRSTPRREYIQHNISEISQPQNVSSNLYLKSGHIYIAGLNVLFSVLVVVTKEL